MRGMQENGGRPEDFTSLQPETRTPFVAMVRRASHSLSSTPRDAQADAQARSTACWWIGMGCIAELKRSVVKRLEFESEQVVRLPTYS